MRKSLGIMLGRVWGCEGGWWDEMGWSGVRVWVWVEIEVGGCGI
jgi:hypothetical protein